MRPGNNIHISIHNIFYGESKMTVGGGFKAITYSMKSLKKVGIKNAASASLSKNTCKACALGMGGQKGGMVNEVGDFPSVCKKSIQAHRTDIQPAIPEQLFQTQSIAEFRRQPNRELS